MVDERPVMTLVSFRTFPSAECAKARRRFYKKLKDVPKSQFPTLRSLLIHKLRIQPDARILDPSTRLGASRDQQRRDRLDKLDYASHLADAIELNIPFYHHYHEVSIKLELGLDLGRKRRRVTRDPGPRTMYLTTATLIVVPATLIAQWDREIQKHCVESLRVCVLRNRQRMPSAQELTTKYDVGNLLFLTPID
jgi:hypothetical protein